MIKRMLKVDYTTARGRGVFATCFIPKGQVLEEAPVIVIPPEQVAAIKSTVLFEYFFQWKFGNQDACAICLGMGSMYNHSSAHANAQYIRLYDTLKMRFVAMRDIHAGEEILTNYNGDVDCRRPLWFEENGITHSNQLFSAQHTRTS